MPSQVWGRDPQEAFEEPYEYAVQDQFVREAKALFTRLYAFVNADRHRHTVQDDSLDKAIWLLAMDALDSLRDCLGALTRKEHRVAGKLFRDVMESMDLAAFFHSGTDKSKASLKKWYADEIVPSRVQRVREAHPQPPGGPATRQALLEPVSVHAPLLPGDP